MHELQYTSMLWGALSLSYLKPILILFTLVLQNVTIGLVWQVQSGINKANCEPITFLINAKYNFCKVFATQLAVIAIRSYISCRDKVNNNI